MLKLEKIESNLLLIISVEPEISDFSMNDILLFNLVLFSDIISGTDITIGIPRCEYPTVSISECLFDNELFLTLHVIGTSPTEGNNENLPRIIGFSNSYVGIISSVDFLFDSISEA